jgi:hypothetical protein
LPGKVGDRIGFYRLLLGHEKEDVARSCLV